MAELSMDVEQALSLLIPSRQISVEFLGLKEGLIGMLPAPTVPESVEVGPRELIRFILLSICLSAYF
jgi:hypothetical protein